jgi:S1-C subfamily serine protease
MRALTFTVVCLAWLPATARAEESLSPNMVTAIKAATVFVKIKTPEIAGSGSGFIIKTENDTAYIVTNRHVIEPKEVEVVIERRPAAPRASGRGSRRGGIPGFPVMPTPIPVPGFPGQPRSEERPRTTYVPRIVVHEYKNVDVTVVFRSGTTDEESVHGQLVAIDPDEDLAIVKARGVKQMPKPIGYLQEPKLAETMPIYTFGFPLGDELATSKRSPAITVGKGTVSSLRTDDDGNLAFVQLDAALNHGNSGGPVVDAQGRLVGVAVARIEKDESVNISLAIPGHSVSRLLQGRLDKATFATVRDKDDNVTVRVTAAVVDPLNRIKSAEFDYLAAKSVADKPKPTDALDAVGKCRKLKLTVENGKATGTFLLKKGITEVALLHQTVAIYGDGKRTHSNNLEEIVRVAPRAAAQPATAIAGNPSGGQAQPGQAQPAAGARIFGGAFGPQFRDAAPPKGMLIGFDVGLGKWGDKDIVGALRPIFVNEHGEEVKGELHGTDMSRSVQVKAKKGYAVGGITAKSVAAVDAFCLTFMKIDKDHLDPNDKYESEWVGDGGTLPPVNVSGNGKPAVGLAGCASGNSCTAFGLIFAPDTPNPGVAGPVVPGARAGGRRFGRSRVPGQPAVMTPQPAAPPAKEPEPLTAEARSEILRDLKSASGQTVKNAAFRLVAAKVDDNRGEVSAALAASMKGLNDWDRPAVLDALAAWGTENCESALIEASSSNNPAVRGKALEQLGNKFKDQAAIAAIGKAFTVDRGAASAAMRKVGPAGEKALFPIVKSKDFWARNDAIGVLAEIGGEKSLRLLKRELKTSFANGNPLETGPFNDAISRITRRLESDPSYSAADDPAKPRQRAWSDLTGTFEVEATIVVVKDYKVTLKKADGKEITLPMEKLSDEDQDYVKEYLKATAKPKNPFE